MVSEINISIENLVENLPTLRKKMKLNQQDLADLLGVTRQTIHNIETKKGNISRTTILAILFIFTSDPATSVILSPLGILSN